MPDDDPTPAPQQMSQREAEMAQLGFEPTELTTAEGETVVVYVKQWTREIAKDQTTYLSGVKRPALCCAIKVEGLILAPN